MERRSSCSVVLTVLVFVLQTARGLPGLAIWLDRDDVHKLAGVDMDIFVVKDGVVPRYMTLQHMDKMLPVLPAEVNVINVTWQAPNYKYSYNFTYLRSLDPLHMFDPLLSIPNAGSIPDHRKVFQMTLPCNGKHPGIASLYIKMHIRRGRHPISGSPLKFILRKTCNTFAVCSQQCQNGGVCERSEVCRCQGGFNRPHCQQQKETCKKTCNSHGICILPNRCKCHPGWFGRSCNKNQMLYYELFLRRQNRRREKKRLLRHKWSKPEEDGTPRSRRTPSARMRWKQKQGRRLKKRIKATA